ncbi:hypothetical protein GGD41_001224 [Paraburkholderia bryophila]|uniref:Uncharacterized protein n=1 Tax=Paraburkholderia bryophila TaxID=420952 RepID=A0A7Y9W5G6_9BURK|nr:hypothetical protein [Paraburkholderia bryophila]
MSIALMASNAAHRPNAASVVAVGPYSASVPARAGGAGDFEQRVARADARFACRAASAQQQVTQHRQVLPRAEQMAAVRARAAWHPQVVAGGQRVVFERRARGFMHFLLPCTLQHDRHTMHDHVEEAAYHEAEHDRENELQAGRQAAERKAQIGGKVPGQQARKQAGRGV